MQWRWHIAQPAILHIWKEAHGAGTFFQSYYDHVEVETSLDISADIAFINLHNPFSVDNKFNNLIFFAVDKWHPIPIHVNCTL